MDYDYTKIFTHRGVGIYVPTLTSLGKGADFHFTVERKNLKGKAFMCINDATEAIDRDLFDEAV